MTVDYSSPEGQVRLLINDTGDDPVFLEEEIGGFLHMEGLSVKRAAAQALDTIADDEALTSKAIRTQDLTTDGPKTAAALREHAARLRAQADDDDEESDDGFYFGLVPLDTGPSVPELTQRPYFGWL